MRLSVLIATVLLAAGPASLAQEGKPTPPPQKTPLGEGAKARNKEAMKKRGKGGLNRDDLRTKAQGRTDPLSVTYRRLTNNIQLDDEQQHALLETYNKLSKSAGVESEPDSVLQDQIAQAKQAGDMTEVRRLKRQMRSTQSSHVVDEFLGAAEGLMREDQLEEYDAFRERVIFTRSMNDSPVQRIDSLRDRLDLDEEQAAVFDKLRSELDENLQSSNTSEEDQAKLIESIEDALDRGDMEQVDEFREAAAKLRGGPDEAMTKFTNELTGILREDQLATLDRFMRAGQSGHGAGANGGVNPDRVRDVIAAARRVGLDRDQRTQLRDIEREARGGLAELRRARSRDESQLAGQVRDQVLQILNAEQQAQFNGILSGDKDAARGRARKE